MDCPYCAKDGVTNPDTRTVLVAISTETNSGQACGVAYDTHVCATHLPVAIAELATRCDFALEAAIAV